MLTPHAVVRQGHYHYAAAAPADLSPLPDLVIACIGDLRQRKLEDFLPVAHAINAPAC